MTKRQRLFFAVIALGLAVMALPVSAPANSLGIPDSEYNALIAFYNSAGGSAWTRNDGWATTSTNWYGVTISGGHVVQLNLQNNHLVGSIPPEIGNLPYVGILNLRGNQLAGEVPASIMNLTALQSQAGSISYNALWTDDPALSAFLTSRFPYWYLSQTIAPSGVSARGMTTVTVSWTPIAYTGDSGYYEVGVSSTQGGPYTFDSSRRTSSKYASSIILTGMPVNNPQYYVVRSVTAPNGYNSSTVTSELSNEVLGNPLSIPDSEYNALVALYKSTNGAGWYHNQYWMTNTPGWAGVTISGGHVTQLNLNTNQMTGALPTELGSLTSLTMLNLKGNQISGQIPTSLANLTLLGSSSSISYNALWNTDSTLASFLTSKFPSWDTTQTVPPTNISAKGTSTVVVSWTPITYTADSGYYEVGISNTSGGPYTFDSTRRTPNKSTTLLSINGLPVDKPEYFIVRTVTNANQFSMVSTTSALSSEALANPLNIPDSEFNALVALYNKTGGPGWTHRDYWLTNGPAWYGIGYGGGHVTMINMNSNNLTGPLPAELGNLTYLQYLNIRGNKLMGAIPSSLLNLTQLQGNASAIGYNGLWTNDASLASFLSTKSPNWSATQTIAPTNVTAQGKGSVTVSWTTIPYISDGGYYEIGISSTPGGPYTFDSSRRTYSKGVPSMPIYGLDTNTPHFFAVRTVTLNNNYNPSTLTSDPSAEATEWSTVSKMSKDGSPTAIMGAIVTASFPDCTYVEAKDRSYGIRVTSSAAPVTSGTVNISGTMSSDAVTGERSICADTVLSTGPGDVAPIALPIVQLGGGYWNYTGPGGTGQVGVSGGYGLNNIGLLVRVVGHITQRDTASPATWFRVDDGSGGDVKCVVPTGVTIDPGWNYVAVTGISSCEKPSGSVLRLLRVRSRSDITVY